MGIFHTQFKHLMSIRYFFVFFLLSICSCSGKIIEFTGSKDISLWELDLGSKNQAGKKIGNLPQSINLEGKKTSAFRTESPDDDPTFWVLTEYLGEKTTISINDLNANFKNKAKDDGTNQTNDPATNNQLMRLIMQSYQSYFQKKHGQSIELATEASKIAPRLAAPHILIGLNHLRQRDFTKANAAFVTAKAKDPTDQSLDQLIKASRK